MTHLIVLAHAPLASALREVAVHAFPECGPTLSCIDVQPDQGLDKVERELRQATAGRAPVLVLCDVFGATPCNAALRVVDGVRVRAVAGVNVSMLWRVLCYAAEPLEALVTRAVDGAAQGIMQVGASRPQNQSVQVCPHDQDQHHHQQ